uniref:Uncharacterized protein n=1 Tax=Photinus pyralis TaxID=7054 RepID=A0A1Y1JVR9_PHOPY
MPSASLIHLQKRGKVNEEPEPNANAQFPLDKQKSFYCNKSTNTNQPSKKSKRRKTIVALVISGICQNKSDPKISNNKKKRNKSSSCGILNDADTHEKLIPIYDRHGQIVFALTREIFIAVNRYGKNRPTKNNQAVKYRRC